MPIETQQPTGREREILKKIREQQNLSRAAVELKINRGNLYKHLRKMVRKGILQKQPGRGGYIIRHYHSFGRIFYRLHDIRVTFELPPGVDPIKWRKNRGRVLSLKGFSHNTVELNNTSYELFNVFDRLDAFAFDRSITVLFRDVHGLRPEDSYKTLSGQIRDVGFRLNQMFGFDVYRENSSRVRLSRASLSRVNDGVAELLRKDENKVFVWIDGDLRLVFDFSLKADEMEFPSLDHALADSSIVERFYKEMLSEGDKFLFPKDLRKSLESVNHNIFLVSTALKSVSRNEAFMTGTLANFQERIRNLEDR